MKKVLFILIIFLIGTLTIHAQKVKEIHLKDFGILPNTFENIALSLKEVIKEVEKYDHVKLVFENGRYYIWPENSEQREYFISNTSTEKEIPSKIKTIGLLFENTKNLTIDDHEYLSQ